MQLREIGVIMMIVGGSLMALGLLIWVFHICWNRFHRHDVQNNEMRANPNENIVLSTEQRKPYEGKHFRITVNGIVQCKGDKCNNKAMVETTKWDPRCVECTNNYLKQKVWFCHNHFLGRNI
eukprot:1057813_1